MKPPSHIPSIQPKHYHVSGKAREYLSGNLALLLKSGVAVGEALEALKNTSPSKKLKLAIDQMIRDIEDGMPLWKALERSGVASPQTLALVQLGEQSGKLVDNMLVAARQEEKQRMFRAKLRAAMIYPAFVLSLTFIVGLGVAWFLLPRLSETFANINVELPPISAILIGFGVFLRDQGLWAVPLGIALIIGAVYLLFGAPQTRSLGQRLLFYIPGVARLTKELEIAKFGYLLGTLLEAGLSVTEALELLGRATSVPRYKNFYSYLHKSFEDGYSFSTSLHHYTMTNKLMPGAIQQMIIAGERSGALPETLRNVGDIYEGKADVSTQNLQAVLEPILLLIVWFGVMAVAVAVIIPIYSLVGGLEVQPQ